MASAQTSTRKKQSRNLPREDHIKPVLYRHQDCIPNPKLLQNCERHSLLCLKNKQDLDCHGKVISDEDINDFKHKIKLPNTKVKNSDKSKKNVQAATVNPEQSNGSLGNEEFSKSRKRRLRKRRLLVALAPTLTNIKPTPVEPDQQNKPSPLPIVRPSIVAPPASNISTNRSSETPKSSVKDSRKRSDKSVGSRNKSIKGKTLIDTATQSKADIIKTLEEKTLNSLLQTLVPLTNSSPKKEKPPVPLFSFPEKRLNSSESKVDKDGVFYFGETKHQLEKLASGFNKYNTSLEQEKSEAAQNTEFSKSILSGSKRSSLENCVSSFNFSALNSDRLNSSVAVKSNVFNTDSSLQTNNLESKRVFSDYQSSEHVFKTPVLDHSQFPIQVLNLNRPSVCTPVTSATNSLGLFEHNPIKILNAVTKNIEKSKTLCNTTVLGASKGCYNRSSDDIKHISSSIKLAEDIKFKIPQESKVSLVEEAQLKPPQETPTKTAEEITIKSLESVKISLTEDITVRSTEENKMKPINEAKTNSVDETKMKPTEESKKTNKTREEILFEREAKKAAKAKHKLVHSNKTDLSNKDISVVKSKDTGDKDINIKDKGTDSNKDSLKSFEFLVKKNNDNIGSDSTLDVPTVSKEIGSEIKKHDSLKESQDVCSKSKSELKAERRAKQEAQRAAKAGGSLKTVQSQPKQKSTPQAKKEQPKVDVSLDLGHTEKKTEGPKTAVSKPKLFSHLYYEKTPLTSQLMLKLGNLHPAVVRLGVQYSSRVVVGSNARCVALLHALKQMVNDYTTPSEKDFSRGLEEELGPVTAYLNQCRPLAVSMTNSLRHIKRTLTQLPNNIPDVEARRKICDVVDTYIHEQIDVAGEAICNTVKQKIANGDVILTYGCSSLVYQILVQSHFSGTKFRVVVVDGEPWREGRELLRRLIDKGLSCTYVLITAASFIMREASKVLLGAHALLANGYVMSRAGSSQIALLAHCYNVPVLVCCETHKFCERVQTDAFVYNELGELCCDHLKDKGRALPSLTPLSLAYDITPPDLISAVVTELAVLPCTSVPVILRIRPSESVM